jgi:hypothetical protein
MDTQIDLQGSLAEAVQTEAQARGFDDTATRWLALLLHNDPALPAPTAGAMVSRVLQLPIGVDLTTLDTTLQRLDAHDSAELTTSERRVTAMLLEDMVSRALALMTTLA